MLLFGNTNVKLEYIFNKDEGKSSLYGVRSNPSTFVIILPYTPLIGIVVCSVGSQYKYLKIPKDDGYIIKLCASFMKVICPVAPVPVTLH